MSFNGDLLFQQQVVLVGKLNECSSLARKNMEKQEIFGQDTAQQLPRAPWANGSLSLNLSPAASYLAPRRSAHRTAFPPRHHLHP